MVCNIISLKFAIDFILKNFLVIFELSDLQGPMIFFSGFADIILGRIQKQKLVPNVLLK